MGAKKKAKSIDDVLLKREREHHQVVHAEREKRAKAARVRREHYELFDRWEELSCLETPDELKELCELIERHGHQFFLMEMLFQAAKDEQYGKFCFATNAPLIKTVLFLLDGVLLSDDAGYFDLHRDVDRAEEGHFSLMLEWISEVVKRKSEGFVPPFTPPQMTMNQVQKVINQEGGIEGLSGFSNVNYPGADIKDDLGKIQKRHRDRDIQTAILKKIWNYLKKSPEEIKVIE